MKKAIIIANGEIPAKGLLSKLRILGYSEIYCADGGANSAFKLKLIPKAIIGDLDSVDEEVLKFYEGKTEIVKLDRQDDTDVEKVLKYLIKRRYSNVVLLGATGDRLDHSFGNVGLLLKYSNRLDVKLIHKKSVAQVIAGKNRFETEIGETISLFGFDSKTKFKSKGLKYPLKNITLRFGEREGTSNEASKEEVELDITGGKALLVRELKYAVKNGLV